MIAYSFPYCLLVNYAKIRCRNRRKGFRMKKNIIDDGFRADLVETAFFDGIMEIPHIKKPDKIIIPKGIVPFSNRNKSINYEDFVGFYEYDRKFAKCLLAVDEYVEDLKRFQGVISPDCSLYRDMPLCLQIANIYMNRAVGHFLQTNGIYVIPNIRWGDERTYTKVELPEKVAFLGIDKNSIVSIGTYGCVQSKEDKYYFREGLIAMLDELETQIVIVYGSMPEQIFNGLEDSTTFINIPDWISRKKAGAS